MYVHIRVRVGLCLKEYMTPTAGTRPTVSSVGLATNWRQATVGNQTHSCFEPQPSHLAYCASVAELSFK